MSHNSHTLREAVTVRAPASLSNLGPGFDTLGVAIRGLGDTVSVTHNTGSDITVRVVGDAGIPSEHQYNTASVAAMEVFRKAGYRGGALISVEKGIPYGSGLGGSAASAAAGAAAANHLLGDPLETSELVACALAGEAVASKSIHGDNVIPALVGGVVLVDASRPVRYRKLVPASEIFFAIVVPDLRIQTAEMRQCLPETVDFRTAVTNASSLGLLVHALMEGDVEAIGALVMRDQIVEPIRATRIACYEAVRRAAMAAGASGCAISGSGPTLFAVAATERDASRIADHMSSACRDDGIGCRAFVSRVDNIGACELRASAE